LVTVEADRSTQRSDLGRLEVACGAGLQAAQLDPTDPYADQVSDGVAHCFAHAADLALASLMDDESQPGVTFARAGAWWAGGSLDLRGRRHHAFDVDATAEPLERTLVGRAFDARQILLVDDIPRMRQPVRQLAIIREEEQSFGVAVESPDGWTPAADALEEWKRANREAKEKGTAPPLAVLLSKDGSAGRILRRPS